MSGRCQIVHRKVSDGVRKKSDAFRIVSNSIRNVSDDVTMVPHCVRKVSGRCEIL